MVLLIKLVMKDINWISLWKLCIWCLHWNANPYFLFKASMYFIITAYKSLLFSQIHFHIEVFCWRFFRACQFCWYTFPNKNLILLSLLLRSRLSGVLNRLILNWPYGKLQSFIFFCNLLMINCISNKFP